MSNDSRVDTLQEEVAFLARRVEALEKESQSKVSIPLSEFNPYKHRIVKLSGIGSEEWENEP